MDIFVFKIMGRICPSVLMQIAFYAAMQLVFKKKKTLPAKS